MVTDQGNDDTMDHDVTDVRVSLSGQILVWWIVGIGWGSRVSFVMVWWDRHRRESVVSVGVEDPRKGIGGIPILGLSGNVWFDSGNFCGYELVQ